MLQYHIFRESTGEGILRTKTLRGESSQAKLSPKEFATFSCTVGLDEPAGKRCPGMKEELTTVDNARAALKAIDRTLIGCRKAMEERSRTPNALAEGILKKLQASF